MRPAPLRNRLVLGRLDAWPAREALLPKVTACVAAAADYLERTCHAGQASRSASDWVAEVDADHLRRLFLLTFGDEVAGLLDLALDTPVQGEVTLVLLVMVKVLRGRGLGREAALALFAHLGTLGFERLRLGVAKGEPDAVRFWESLGLWPSGEEDGVRLFELPLRQGGS